MELTGKKPEKKFKKKEEVFRDKGLAFYNV